MTMRNQRKTLLFVILTAMMIFNLNFVSAGFCSDGNALKVGRVGTLVKTLDPNIVINWGGSMPIKSAIFEGLLRYNTKTLELEKCLAEKWEVSDDGKILTFYLRKGVQFHQGFGELTANDVKATIDRNFEPKKWDLHDAVKWIPPLSKIEVEDKYTVKFHLEYADYTIIPSTMPMFFGWITSKKALDQYGPEGIKTQAIGTGPYEIEKWVPMRELSITKYSGYWGEKPKYDKVSFISFGSLQALGLALKAGEVDIAPINPEDVGIYKADKKLKTQLFQPPGFSWVGFNVKHPVMSNIKLRQAIRYAINVDEILQVRRGGVVENPSSLRANSILSPSTVSGYWEDAPVYKTDLQKAKALLTEAGYPDGLSLTMPAPLHYGGEPEIGAVVQAQLKKVGIKIEIPVMDLSAFRDEHFKDMDKFPLFVESWNMAPFPEQQLIWFTCKQVESWNEMKWCNPVYDDLLKSAKGQIDSKKRHSFFIEMQKLMDKDVIAVWIDYPLEAQAWRKEIDAKFWPCGWNDIPGTK